MLIIETRAAKAGVKGCLYNAARGKPTTSDKVLGEELGDDMPDVGRVDPVEGRYRWSTFAERPKGDLGIRHCCDHVQQQPLGRAGVKRGMYTQPESEDVNWAKFCHCVKFLLLRLVLCAFCLFQFNDGHACDELALTFRFTNRVDVLRP